MDSQELLECMLADSAQGSEKSHELTGWDTASVHQLLGERASQDASDKETEASNSNNDSQSGAKALRSTERLLEKAPWLPASLKISELQDEFGRGLTQLVANSLEALAKKRRMTSLVLQVQVLEGTSSAVVVVSDGRGARRWVFLDDQSRDSLIKAIDVLVEGKNALIWPHGEVTAQLRALVEDEGTHQLSLPSGNKVQLALTAYRGTLNLAQYPDPPARPEEGLTHLDHLEAESIHIMREVAAEFENPVMMYSCGDGSP